MRLRGMGALLVATLVGAAVFLLTYAVAWLTVRDQSAFDEVVGLVGFLVYVGIPVGAVSLWAWRFARRRWGDRMTWRGAAMWTGRLVGWIAVFTLWLWVIWDFTTLAWPPDGALVLSLVAAAGRTADSHSGPRLLGSRKSVGFSVSRIPR